MLSTYAAQHAEEGLEILGFSLDNPGTLPEVRRVSATLNFPVGLLGSAGAGDYGRMWRLPVSFVIDRQGILRYDGGRLSSDGGLLVVREVERRLGLAERLAAAAALSPDSRRSLGAALWINPSINRWRQQKTTRSCEERTRKGNSYETRVLSHNVYYELGVVDMNATTRAVYVPCWWEKVPPAFYRRHPPAQRL